MEKLINDKTTLYFKKFKDDIVSGIKELHLPPDDLSNILGVIYNYPHILFKKTDLQKRKRIKNSIPLHDRCMPSEPMKTNALGGERTMKISAAPTSKVHHTEW